LLAVLGAAALLTPLPVPAAAVSFDLPVVIAVAVACLPIFFTGNRIARWEGALFLFYFCAYTGYLLLAAGEHDATTTVGLAMQAVVIPLTAVTLLVILVREWQARHR
ncbi:MAG: sodium:calcium antiporter, partial [Gammaproteobacteria bacterium]|nr:sodium:calcium antiporter [Gammaproteobacteria bacterium]